MPEGSTKKERRGNSGICAPPFYCKWQGTFLRRGLIPVEISPQEMKTGSILILYMSKVPA